MGLTLPPWTEAESPSGCTCVCYCCPWSSAWLLPRFQRRSCTPWSSTTCWRNAGTEEHGWICPRTTQGHGTLQTAVTHVPEWLHNTSPADRWQPLDDASTANQTNKTMGSFEHRGRS